MNLPDAFKKLGHVPGGPPIDEPPPPTAPSRDPHPPVPEKAPPEPLEPPVI